MLSPLADIKEWPFLNYPYNLKVMPRLVNWQHHIGERMRLRDLRVLLAVAESGSMAKAAAGLKVTQPAVSKAIGNLEQTLGVRLFDRGPRGIQSTNYGDALVRCASVVFDEMRLGVQQIEALANPNEGDLHVGCPESLTGFVSTIITRLSVQYPNIVVHTSPAFPALLQFDDLRNRNVDLLLGRVSQASVDDDIAVESLFADSLLVVAGTQHPRAHSKRLTLSSLLRERWILLPSGNPISSVVARAFEAEGSAVPPAASTSVSLHMTNHLLATGRFLAFMFSSVLRQNEKQWKLKSLPIELTVRPPPVAILTLRQRTANPVARYFIAQARALARSMSSG